MSPDKPRQSAVVKRSVVVSGRKTSVSIEDAFWSELKAIARQKGLTVSGLVQTVHADRSEGANLSSAIRVYVLGHVRSQQKLKGGPGSDP